MTFSIVARSADGRAVGVAVAGDGYAIQGNMLAGPAVVDDMEAAWLAAADQPELAYRLLAVLRAGDRAGGDRRGRQSAVMLVVAKGMGYAKIAENCGML
jgi:uncharacterized Ntn-hydrolase superfamily protein